MLLRILILIIIIIIIIITVITIVILFYYYSFFFFSFPIQAFVVRRFKLIKNIVEAKNSHFQVKAVHFPKWINSHT